MLITTAIAETRAALRSLRRLDRTVGLVPTMGAFHEGHLSLIRQARRECDVAAVSVFVNPMQFGAGEDLASYPHPFEDDCAKAESEGADLVFAPQSEEMYQDGFATSVHVSRLTEGLCGARRPGHFDGVCTVVLKLFDIVEPDRAYFGEKDYQQLKVIERMVRDLNLPVGIAACPTVRELDGLAMSSRNAYLSPEERKAAAQIPAALSAAARAFAGGEKSAARLMDVFRLELGVGLAEPEYASVVDSETLQEVDQADGSSRLVVAVKVGRARLIDNLALGAGAVKRL
jgi:pantoate--beta-alanine ligase